MQINPDLRCYNESTEHNLICVENQFRGLIRKAFSDCTIYETQNGNEVAYKFRDGKVFIHKELSFIGL